MAEEIQIKSHEYEASSKVGGEGSVESKDRGLFDFLGKKDEEKKHQEEVISTEFGEKIKVSEEEPKHKVEKHNEEEEKKPSLLEKLHRSDSSSSSSSDEEEGEGEEKKKKKKEKKGLKEKIKEKISGEDKEEEKKEEYHHYHEADTSVPIEHEVVHSSKPIHPEEKKGFLEKIKDKLPGGQHKKPEEAVPASAPAPDHHEYSEASHEGGEAKEKKGILEKIKEKLPGYHSKTEEEKEKEREKESGSHY
ncbi:Dehydrin [Parasponia andersonii]|uniref:Dehydrin n=1 Tax=Parasponia andersonii TaxID=3476 RepID=A0A2P5CHT6_PARAD|nr:Dehydrin [Parasponia andersonii]